TISIADKVRLGRATIGLMLSKYERGIATEAPLRRLAEEMGYPDLETLLVAVVARTVDPNTVVERRIAMADSPCARDGVSLPPRHPLAWTPCSPAAPPPACCSTAPFTACRFRFVTVWSGSPCQSTSLGR